jgi:hypothetical protein
LKLHDKIPLTGFYKSSCFLKLFKRVKDGTTFKARHFTGSGAIK